MINYLHILADVFKAPAISTDACIATCMVCDILYTSPVVVYFLFSAISKSILLSFLRYSFTDNPFLLNLYVGYAVAQLAEALCHKPEGRGFGSR
jgi:hypothetical protein